MSDYQSKIVKETAKQLKARMDKKKALGDAAPDLLDLAKEALAQLEKMDFTCSANWNGSIKTNVSLLLSAAIEKAEGRA